MQLIIQFIKWVSPNRKLSTLLSIFHGVHLGYFKSSVFSFLQCRFIFVRIIDMPQPPGYCRFQGERLVEMFLNSH